MQTGRKNQELATYIQGLRNKRGLTQQECAKRAGIDRSYLSRLERGLYGHPDPARLERLAHVLGVDAASVFLAAGYRDTANLPEFNMYFRSKYQLPQEAIEELHSYFDFLSERYDREGKSKAV